MKKSRFLVLGLIALILAGGLVLASCGSKCDNDGNCYWSGEGSIPSNSAGGVCANTSDCVIFDAAKGMEAVTNGTRIDCNC